MHKKIKNISFFYYPDNEKAIVWEKNIREWLKERYPEVNILPLPKDLNNCGASPEVIIALGGDGTIIELARKANGCGVLIFGLNLGNIGFIASVRRPEDFLAGMEKLMKGEYRVDTRMKMSAEIIRGGNKIAELSAINEVVVHNLLGMVELDISIEKYPLQYIRGSGVMVSTASGSTAYNLSAHGPIVMPELNCFIITELFDHNIPTPSVIIKENKEILVKVEYFRERGKISLSQSGESADVVAVADGADIVSLIKGDCVVIRKSKDTVNFVEIEPNYFFKSLKEKFAFK
jgi:NAD+ kinase